jgi:hypothetical protein
VDEYKRAHVMPVPSRTLSNPGRGAATIVRQQSTIDVTQPNVTGINRWWSYREGAIPGVGHYMVNAWQQNLIVQVDDMLVKNRGIDLTFRRTYNSYSGHDYAGTDGAVAIGQFGNGWTNTFDAHISQNSAGGVSVHDIDGARTIINTTRAETMLPRPAWKARASSRTAGVGSIGRRRMARNTCFTGHTVLELMPGT